MPGPNKKGYVRVPLPPAYLLAILACTENRNKASKLTIYPSQLIYSKADIHGIVPATGKTPEQVQKDLPRTHWRLGKKRDNDFFGKLTPYSIALISEDLTLKENKLYIEWQADSQTLRYKVLGSKNKVNEGVTNADALKTRLGTQRYSAFILRLTILQSEEFVKKNTITKTNLVNLLGDTACTNFIDSLKLKKNTENSLVLSDSAKKNLLNALFSTLLDPFLEDLLRITAQAGHTSLPGADISIQEMVSKSGVPESGLKLTEDEARALSAFRHSVKKNTILQGGMFSFPDTTITAWIINILTPIEKTTDYHIIRNKKKLEVIYTQSVDFYGVTSDKTPLLMYSNQYEMQKEGDGFTLTRMDNKEEVCAWFEENFFHETLIPLALERLKATKFDEEDLLLFIPFLSNEAFAHEFSKKFIGQKNISKETLHFLIKHFTLCFGELGFWDHHNLIPLASKRLEATKFDEEDLRFFIPFLSNETFAHQFSEKFMGQENISKEKLSFLINQITLCFGELSFWNRHQGKISLSIFGLFLAAIIITGIVMTFGLPVVMGVLGGALFFGLAAAAVGVVVTMVGGLVGAKFDADYLLPFTLGSIKTESKGKLVEREVLDENASVEEEEVTNPDVERGQAPFETSKETTKKIKSKTDSPLLDNPSGGEDDDDVSTEEEGDTTVKDSKESSSVDSATDSDGEDNDENIDEKKDTQKNFKEDSPKDSSNTSDSDSEEGKNRRKASGSGASEDITLHDEENADNPIYTGNTSLSASAPSAKPAGVPSSEDSSYKAPLFQKPKNSSTVKGDGITTTPTLPPGQTKASSSGD